VGDHRIVVRIRVFGDVEILLDDAPHVGKERPVGAETAAILIRLSNIVSADRNKPAIADLELAVQLDEPFGLPAVLWSVASAAEDQNHGMLSLQFRELPVLCGMVGQLIVGEDRPRNNVGSHLSSSTTELAGVGAAATPTSAPRGSGRRAASSGHGSLMIKLFDLDQLSSL
jgi:hypothetical protein